MVCGLIIRAFLNKDNHGFLYTPNGIASGEFTVYIRPHSEHIKLVAGRNEATDAKHSTPFANYEYSHYAYHKVPITIYPHGRVTPEVWYGMKAIRIVHPTRKFCDFYLNENEPFVDSRPSNNWKLIAYYRGMGDKDMDRIACTWKSHKDLVRIDGFRSVDFALLSTRAINVGWSGEQQKYA